MSTDQPNPDAAIDNMFDRGFLDYYAMRVNTTMAFDEKQRIELVKLVKNPLFQVWLKELSTNIVRDLMKLRFERPDEHVKLAARYARGNGAIEVIDTILQLGE